MERVQRISLYYRPKENAFPDNIHDFLSRHAISRSALLRHFVPVATAATALNTTPGAARQAIKHGRLGTPLYDYSKYDTVQHYKVWVQKNAVLHYVATRKSKR